ncbi:MAG: carboxymuconolactone decarboxylase family protein, partial [Gammaproteobacteria bacterium]
MARFDDLPPEKYTADQRKVAEAIAAGPRGAVGGPFPTRLRRPELASRIADLGEYIRFQRILPIKYVSIAILMTARHW